MIYVSGDAYSALEFERYFSGQSVKSIIERFLDGNEEHDGDFEMEFYEFEYIDPEFIDFVRNQIQDYDDSKHSNFYFEDRILE